MVVQASSRSEDGLVPPIRLLMMPTETQKAPSTIETKRVDVTIDEKGNKMVNQYLLMEKLGTGSYGKSEIRDKNMPKIAASEKADRTAAGTAWVEAERHRHIADGGAGANTALDDVMREIEIMKRLRHPNIVRLIEVINDEEDDRLFLVMELLEGGPVMNKNLEDGPLPLPTARKYFIDVVRGLEYLHSQKIIHRDLKPENLLLSADGVVKISDFGVSHTFEGDDDTLKVTAGSPAFLAPELCAAGTVPRGQRVDVWALGVTLYCFVFGKVPYMADNVLDMYEKIRSEPPISAFRLTFPSPIPPDLQDLLQRLLTKDPEKRITLQQVKKHPWVTGGS